MAQEAKQGGRIITRWIAECPMPDTVAKNPATFSCRFNDRKDKRLHATKEGAVRESAVALSPLDELSRPLLPVVEPPRSVATVFPTRIEDLKPEQIGYDKLPEPKAKKAAKR